MKLFKRMAAVAMAAILSLGVLTACGGSTSTSATRLAKLVGEMKKTGRFYVEIGDSNTYHKIAQDENYEINLWKDGDENETSLTTRTGDYYWKENNGEWKKEWFGGTFSKLIPSEGFLAALKVVPNYEIEGKGTFYAEVLYTENYDLSNAEWDGASSTEEMAYCFDGNDVKYFVWKIKDGTTFVYNEKMGTEFPEEITAVRESFEDYLKQTT